jgi:hypothetical protein
MGGIMATDTKRFWRIFVAMYLMATIPGYLYASQELPASGELKPLSGINRAWLDQVGGTSSWGRNPFYFPRAEDNSSPARETTVDTGGLQLSAILYHETGSVAIINHQIVRQGDQIEGRKVVSILEDRVILQDLSGISELRLNSFSLK